MLVTVQSSSLPLSESNFYFVHRSLQEFLATTHWHQQFTSINPVEKEVAIAILQANKFENHYAAVWQFSAGLCAAHQDNSQVNAFFDLLVAPPRLLYKEGKGGSLYELALFSQCWDEVVAAEDFTYELALTRWALDCMGSFVRLETESLLLQRDIRLYLNPMYHSYKIRQLMLIVIDAIGKDKSIHNKYLCFLSGFKDNSPILDQYAYIQATIPAKVVSYLLEHAIDKIRYIAIDNFITRHMTPDVLATRAFLDDFEWIESPLAETSLYTVNAATSFKNQFAWSYNDCSVREILVEAPNFPYCFGKDTYLKINFASAALKRILDFEEKPNETVAALFEYCLKSKALTPAVCEKMIRYLLQCGIQQDTIEALLRKRLNEPAMIPSVVSAFKILRLSQEDCLLTLLKSDNLAIQLKAINTCVTLQIKTTAIKDALYRLLQDASLEIRFHASITLTQLGEKRTTIVDTLLQVFSSRKADSQRCSILVSLQMLKIRGENIRVFLEGIPNTWVQKIQPADRSYSKYVITAAINALLTLNYHDMMLGWLNSGHFALQKAIVDNLNCFVKKQGKRPDPAMVVALSNCLTRSLINDSFDAYLLRFNIIRALHKLEYLQKPQANVLLRLNPMFLSNGKSLPRAAGIPIIDEEALARHPVMAMIIEMARVVQSAFATYWETHAAVSPLQHVLDIFLDRELSTAVAAAQVQAYLATLPFCEGVRQALCALAEIDPQALVALNTLLEANQALRTTVPIDESARLLPQHIRMVQSITGNEIKLTWLDDRLKPEGLHDLVWYFWREGSIIRNMLPSFSAHYHNVSSSHEVEDLFALVQQYRKDGIQPDLVRQLNPQWRAPSQNTASMTGTSKPTLPDFSTQVRPDINTAYQYEDTDVNRILEARLQQLREAAPDNRLLQAIQVMAPVDNVVPGQLQARLVEEQGRYTNTHRYVLIPCNIGLFHWVGICLEIGADNCIIRAEYLESTDSAMSKDLQAQFQAVYPGIPLKLCLLLLQDDGTSCGAYAVENLLLAVQGQAADEKLSAYEIRAGQLASLQRYDNAFYTPFNQRQRDNIPTVGSFEQQDFYQKQLAEIRFSAKEQEVILRTAEQIKQLSYAPALWQALENGENTEAQVHLDAIRAVLHGVMQTASSLNEHDLSLTEQLVNLLFAVTWSRANPLPNLSDYELRVQYQLIVAIAQHHRGQIAEDVAVAQKLQPED